MKKISIIGNNASELFANIHNKQDKDAYTIKYVHMLYEKAIELIQQGYDYFLCGATMGVDIDFAQILLFLKTHKYNNINFELAVTNHGFGKDADLPQTPVSKKIFAQAYTISLLEPFYFSTTLFRRNRYMIDTSEKIIFFWNGDASTETYDAIQYANSKRKVIEIINLG